MKFLFIISLLVMQISFVLAQDTLQNKTIDTNSISFSSPKEYTLAGINLIGAKDLMQATLINLSGLTIGEKLNAPGDKLAKAIDNLWKQGLFNDINISANKIEGDNLYIDINLETKPRLAKFSFKGVRKSDADDIREIISLRRGKVVTDNLLMTVNAKIIDYYKEKGFLDSKVNIVSKVDSIIKNTVDLDIRVTKGKKIRIGEVYITGNTAINTGKLRRTLKETKRYRWWNVFNSAKFNKENYELDKEKIVAKYASKGYRDAQISFDTVYKFSPNRLVVKLNVSEGNKYYFGDFKFYGNAKYPTTKLKEILAINKGDIFNQDVLNMRLNGSPDGRDIASLYMDDGYLFFQTQPSETNINGDTIDFEVRIQEGRQARINRVTISGNTKTNDRVVLREIRTKPGMLFSRADIIRTQRELAQLRYFDETKLGVNPIPNPTDGTVDIEYTVEEKSNDQVQLSGGYGAGRLIGTLGLTLNNFSTKNIFKSKGWDPIPSGDGQSLSLQGSTSGRFYSTLSASFMEPWLGGKKPNALSVTVFYNTFNTSGVSKKENPLLYNRTQTIGFAIGLGKRLKKPDDFFVLNQDISLQRYKLENVQNNNLLTDGIANNLSYNVVLSRSSIDAAVFPTAGSLFKMSLQLTPPYSLFRRDANGNKLSTADFSALTAQQKYRWSEYHKWKFTGQWYHQLFGKFVLNTKAGIGLLGFYNEGIGVSPFERFNFGGSGLSGTFNIFGSEIIALRGYAENGLDNNNLSLNPVITESGQRKQVQGSALVKYSVELRYPISLNPQFTVYGLAFLDAGNSWYRIREFSPFDLKRGTGFGVRALIPMIGMIGLDYGWNLDTGPVNPLRNDFKPNLNFLNGKLGKGQFHFTIGANIGDL